ncbi:MAG: hypothetical protein K2Y40_02055 [Reyranella sp.]|nr:hypothetical protein [Reyranella sp.]
MSNPDLEVWLLFAPFWALGLFALAGAIWHLVHFAVVHAPKGGLFAKRPAGHELSHAGRHHLKWGLIAVGALVGLCAGAALVALVFSAR